MGMFLRREIGTIFIMLGNSCNMHCKYCLQHPLVEHGLTGHINPDIYPFIEQVAEENGPDHPLWLHFFGGEPLIYFPAMKKVVEKTKHLKNVRFSTITNGKAITLEMVEFFNRNQFHVAVSWDGKNVMDTRGYDVLAPGSQTRELLFQLDMLNVCAVLSSRAYPQEVCDAFQSLSKEYFDIHGYPLTFGFDPILDTGLGDKTLVDMDYDRVSREVAAMTERYMKFRTEGAEMKIAERAFMEPVFSNLQRVNQPEKKIWNRQYCPCGNGYNILNMDLAGNLYHCHNVSQKSGSIYTPYFQYLNEVLKHETTFSRREKCMKCPAMLYCRGGCKLVQDKDMEKGMCKLRQAIFQPVLEAAIAYGKKVMGGKDGR